MRGFGTTIGIVLAIVGLALIFILTSDMIGRGSRITFERAIYAARATVIAEEAITEVCFTPANRQRFLDALVDTLNAQASTPGDAILTGLLAYLNPRPVPPAVRDPSTIWNATDVDLAPKGFPGVWLVQPPYDPTGPVTKVAFGRGSREWEATEVKKLREEEFRGIRLTIGPVKVRPVHFVVQTERGGWGVVRSEVSVKVPLSRGTFLRRVTIDREFELRVKTPPPPLTGKDKTDVEVRPLQRVYARDVGDVG
jgi:hypothetical protein